MNPRALAKGAVFAAGAAAGIAAAAWASQRLAARNIRRAPDADASRVLDTPIYVDCHLDTPDRGTIHVVESGEGPPIMLSHGVTLSVRTWFHQLELLPKEGYRAIAYDHRGHGESVLGEAGHSLDNLADDVKTVLLGLDLRDAVLVGHSMGGVAVQSFVIRNPELAAERVRGIVLLSTLAKTPFGSRSTQMKSRLERVFKRVPDTGKLWAQPNLGLLAARVGFGKDAHPSHVELVRRMMLACPAETRRDAPACPDRARPHRRAAVRRHSDACDRRHGGRAHPAGVRRADGAAHSRCPARTRRGRRTHAHARTRRTPQPTDPRLRTRGFVSEVS